MATYKTTSISIVGVMFGDGWDRRPACKGVAVTWSDKWMPRRSRKQGLRLDVRHMCAGIVNEDRDVNYGKIGDGVVTVTRSAPGGLSHSRTIPLERFKSCANYLTTQSLLDDLDDEDAEDAAELPWEHDGPEFDLVDRYA